MQAVDFTKLISLNETAAFLWKTAEKQGEFTVRKENNDRDKISVLDKKRKKSF